MPDVTSPGLWSGSHPTAQEDRNQTGDGRGFAIPSLSQQAVLDPVPTTDAEVLFTPKSSQRREVVVRFAEGTSGVASEFAAGPLFWFQQRRVRAPPGTRGQSCSPALTREPRRPPSRVPGRSPGQGRRSGVPFPWCRRMTLCDLGPGLDVLVSGSRASLWVEMLPASQRGAWGEVQKVLSAPQDAASGGHCHHCHHSSLSKAGK